MTCREYAELLLDYLAGELPPEDDARVQAHQDACPPCVHLTETYRLTVIITRRLPPVAMSAETAARLQEALRRGV